MAQASWWPDEARDAVASYDDLMGRLSAIADDVRGDILEWLGRTDVLGSPAERYQVVTEALSQGVEPDEVLRGRVGQLKAFVSEFAAKVKNAETYGTLPAATATGGTPEASMNELCLTGGVALLGLVVVPLLLGT